MTKKKLALILLIIFLALFGSYLYLRHQNIAVLNPAGTISSKERQLIYIALILSAIVVIPVYVLTIFIAMKYRESNTAKYSPDWDHNSKIEAVWWGIPLVIITILSVITWISSHELDPYKTFGSYNSLTIQVVALDWKWLFIYPNDNVASVNQLVIPTNTEIDFHITSDTVMNSFWIPNLGSQIYAMPGMITQDHLIALKSGSFYGSSANISGVGFAGMHFQTVAVNSSDYDNWLSRARHSSSQLDLSSYNSLAKPSENNPQSYYSSVEDGLFDNIVYKYMSPIVRPS